MKKLALIMLIAGASTHLLAMKENAPRDVLSQQLVIAARDGNSEKIKELIQNGADPDYESSLNCWTPLIAAANYNHDEAIKILLKAGANPDYIPSNGNDSALQTASESTNKGTKNLKDLIEFGANIYLETGFGTALYGAIKNDNMQAAQILLNAATTLTLHEKDSIKNWLLLNQKMRTENEKERKD